jgi:hypothetical protein
LVVSGAGGAVAKMNCQLGKLGDRIAPSKLRLDVFVEHERALIAAAVTRVSSKQVSKADGVHCP